MPAARVRMPSGGRWPTAAAFLLEWTGQAEEVRRRLAAGEVVLGDGSPVRPGTAYRPGRSLYLYRDLPPEPEVPGEVTVLYRDEDLVVVDKPHFLATMPRGSHVAQTVVVRLRRELGLPELAPAHRLDRLTAGVLVLTARREVRGAYQSLFARQEVAKTYLAVAPRLPPSRLPCSVQSRLVKHRGELQAREEPGEPNSRTAVELLREGDELAMYRLRPTTGRTHQLRVHLAGLGAPVAGDPLYPQVRKVAVGDFSRPLQLLAASLSFRDPLTGRRRAFTTRRWLALAPGGPGRSGDLRAEGR